MRTVAVSHKQSTVVQLYRQHLILMALTAVYWSVAHSAAVTASSSGNDNATQILDDIKQLRVDYVQLRQEMDYMMIRQRIAENVTRDIGAELFNIQTTVNNRSFPRDCADIKDQGHITSGVYTVYVGRHWRPLVVYCDMTSNGGGWLAFQRRFNGQTSFYRDWNDYTNGFGSVYDEFWLGNNNIHALTLDKKYTLRIDLADFNGNSRYAEYTDFKVGSACEKYKLLSVGTYCGNAGDSLTAHVGMQFSTFDQDNDVWANACAVTFRGAWWYSACHASNLNGAYLYGAHSSYADGVEWYYWTGHNYSLRVTEMKIRPSDTNI